MADKVGAKPMPNELMEISISRTVTHEMMEKMGLHDNMEANQHYYIGKFGGNLDRELLETVDTRMTGVKYLGFVVYLVMNALREFVDFGIGKYEENDHNGHCVSLADLKELCGFVNGLFLDERHVLSQEKKVNLAHRVWKLAVEKWTKTTPRHLTSWLDKVASISRLSTFAITRGAAIGKWAKRSWEKNKFVCHDLSGVAHFFCRIISKDSDLDANLLGLVAERIHVSLRTHNPDVDADKEIFKAEVLADVLLFARTTLAVRCQGSKKLLTHPPIADGISYRSPVAPTANRRIRRRLH